MTRPPLLASTLLLTAVTALTSGCATLGLEHPPTAAPATPTVERSSAKPSAPAASKGLTKAQAQAALITDRDLGAPWTPTRGAATWRDGMLKVTASPADCQRLLDDLYADELLGGPVRAVVALDDPDSGAQLRYQLTGSRPTDVDHSLARLRTLPQTCARFTAKAADDAVLDVQVSELPLPEVGDVRQGLRVTLTRWAGAGENAGESAGGDPTVLTLDVAAVRAGEDAFALTNGGLDDAPNAATQAAVQLGVRRLEDVRKQGQVRI
ncbi:hypothetical protein PYK79_42825 [Streptomyces sp. ID05-04B]|uniref:hypothetical protein n=1 Tax=unclassified Streptomyces TaxID=2593676 RepID=UPI000D1A4DEE|nr:MULTISPECIES: hypothetical protein [unclassified Streptomyces]AVV41755.1 hypothetical protein C6376_10165 [Streptomyces sp. P3]MDX5568727.1 hypothetical protein [Streptomyces sp. ID05-04B]